MRKIYNDNKTSVLLFIIKNIFSIIIFDFRRREDSFFYITDQNQSLFLFILLTTSRDMLDM